MGHLDPTSCTSPADVVAAVSAWMVGGGAGQLGMTMWDNISSTHKVIKTTGIGGNRQPLYFEISASQKDEAIGDSGMGAMDNIVINIWANWDNGSHVGNGGVTRDGGRHYLMPTQASGGSSTYGKSIDEYVWNKPAYFAKPDLLPYDIGSNNGIFTSNGYGVSWGIPKDFVSVSVGNRGNSVFNGRGVYYLVTNTPFQLRFCDFSQVELGSSAKISDMPWGNTAACASIAYTIDAANGKEYLWVQRFTGVNPGNIWYRYDVILNAWTNMADPPWGTSVDSGGFFWCWDGGDFIYVTQNLVSGSVTFARYSISGNSWTTLANTPAWSLGSSQYTRCNNRMIYIPASLSGDAEDMIYWEPTATSGSSWYRYKVTSAAWETSGGIGFPNLPASIHQDSHWMAYDPCRGSKGSIFWYQPTGSGNNTFNPNSVYAFDINTKTWSSALSNLAVNNNAWAGDISVDGIVGRLYWGALYLPTTSASLVVQAVGDLDAICVLATWVPPGGTTQVQRMVYAGFLNTHMKTDKFTAAASISPGLGVTIQVNETITGKLEAGDSIRIFDPTVATTLGLKGGTLTPGGSEIVTISAIVDANHFTVTQVNGTYGSGVFLSQAGLDAVVGNDTMKFGCLFGQRGYGYDGCTDTYRASPPIPKTRTDPIELRNVAGLSGIELYNPDTNCNTPGQIGQLKFLATANPQASANDTDSVSDAPFIVFDPYLKSRLSVDNRLLEMGPTNG